MKFSLARQISIAVVLVLLTPLSVLLVLQRVANEASSGQIRGLEAQLQLVSEQVALRRDDALILPDIAESEPTWARSIAPRFSFDIEEQLGLVNIFRERGSALLEIELPTTFDLNSSPPSQALYHDHIKILGDSQTILIYRSSDIALQAVRLNGSALTFVSGSVRDTSDGALINIRLPISLLNESTRIDFINVGTIRPSATVVLPSGNSFRSSESHPPILQTAFKNEIDQDVGFFLVDQYGNVMATNWLRAPIAESVPEAKSALSRLIEALVLPRSRLTHERLSDLISSTRATTESDPSWQMIGLNRALVISKPVITEHGLMTLTAIDLRDRPSLLVSTSFSSYFGTTAPIAILMAMGLLFWAVTISIRIRKLARETASQAKKYGISLTPSTSGDEITTLKTQFEQLNSMVAAQHDYLEQLAVRLTHELKTPISVVSSSIDLMELSASEEASERHIERARSGIHQLRAIFTAMTEARSLEQSIAVNENDHFELTSTTQSIIEGWQLARPQPEITFESSCTEAACGNAELYAQAMIKILDNAGDFCEKNTPVIVKIESRKGRLRVIIENRGPALPEPPQQIFESLVSYRSANLLGAPHLGFGLYIARMIIKSFGGDIEASSQSGTTRFILSLRPFA